MCQDAAAAGALLDDELDDELLELLDSDFLFDELLLSLLLDSLLLSPLATEPLPDPERLSVR